MICAELTFLDHFFACPIRFSLLSYLSPVFGTTLSTTVTTRDAIETAPRRGPARARDVERVQRPGPVGARDLSRDETARDEGFVGRVCRRPDSDAQAECGGVGPVSFLSFFLLLLLSSGSSSLSLSRFLFLSTLDVPSRVGSRMERDDDEREKRGPSDGLTTVSLAVYQDHAVSRADLCRGLRRRSIVVGDIVACGARGRFFSTGRYAPPRPPFFFGFSQLSPLPLSTNACSDDLMRSTSFPSFPPPGTFTRLEID